VPTQTRKRTSKATSANRVKQLLLEIAYRTHSTRVVGVKPVRTASVSS
jgi:hypothetical protein